MKKQGKVLALLAVSSLFWGINNVDAASAAEQEDGTYSFSGVVVTATKIPEKIQDTPASVSVITAKEIQDKNISSVAQAFGQLSGVYLNPVADGGISLRGFSSDKALVMVDGQPVNNGWDGEVYWSMIPTDNIAKIEVVRGAGSSLYGGRAVGGVIQITTKNPDKGLHGNALVSYGSNASWKQAYSATFSKDKWDFGVGYEKKKTHGWRGYYIDSTARSKTSYDGTPIEADLPESARGRYIVGGRGRKALDTESYNFKTTYHFSDNKSLSYDFLHTNHTYVYNHPFSDVRDADGNEVFYGAVKLPSGKYVDLDPGDFLGYTGQREWDVHSFSYNDDDNHIYAHLGITDVKKDGYSSTSGPSGAVTASELNSWNGEGTYSFYPSKTYDFDIHKSWELGDHTLLAGGGYRRISFDQTRDYLKNWRDLDSSKTAYEKHGGKGISYAGYLQDKWQVNDDLALYAGVRYDKYTKKDGYSDFLETGIHTNHPEKSYEQWSPKLSVEYNLNGTTLFASYGRSFTPPLLYRVYRENGMSETDINGQTTVNKKAIIANPALKPETTDTYEIGARKAWDHTSVSVSLYRADTDDAVKYYTTSASTLYNGILYKKGFSQYRNMGEGRTDGVEVEFKRDFNKITSGYINYAWQNATIDGEHDYDVPKHILHFGVEWKPQERWDILADAEYISARQAPDVDTDVYKSEDAFFITNLAANYSVNKNTTLQFSIYNLFDKKFYASEAASERTYNLSVRYSF